MTPPQPALSPIRLVLDTNAWLDLLLFDDAALNPLPVLANSSRLQLMTSVTTREEWRRVLGYPQLALDAARQTQLVRRFDALAVVHQLDPLHPDAPLANRPPLPRCRDPDDQKFLELAQVCDASAVLTRDKELLTLNRRCRRAAGFAVQRPADWLASNALAPD